MQALKTRIEKVSGGNPSGEQAMSIGSLTTLIDGAKEMLAAIAPGQAEPMPGAVDQPAKRDTRAAADAAGKTYEALRAAYETDTVTLDLLCDWSKRWLNAELAAANSQEQKIAALEAYVLRTLQTQKKVKALYDNGARGGEVEKYFGMVFYLEEAKDMLKAARRRATMENANAAKGPVDGPPASADTAPPTTSPYLNLLNTKKFPYPLTNVQADPKSLRFDGKTFDQRREELLTELKPERRTEAIRAFRAFAANGLGRDAAQAIVDVMRGHDVWTIDNSPEGVLKATAINALATSDHADAVPVLLHA